MTGPSDTEFELTHLSSVAPQIQSIFAAARDAQERDHLADIVTQMVQGIRHNALTWGDPLYQTKKEGGAVFGRVVWPLRVKYVAYEIERAVCILSIERVDAKQG